MPETKSAVNDMTTGSIKRSLVIFALPLVISNLLQSLYGAVDMYFAGQFLGTDALCAISVSGPVVNLLLGAIAGMSVGVTVMIGTYIGHHDTERVKHGIGTAVTVYAIAALAITALGFIFTPLLLTWTNTPPEAYDAALSYLRINFLGVVFTLGYNLICSIRRGMGDSRSSMYFVIAATIFNGALDYILLRYTDLGVTGTAIATIAAQALSCLLGLIYLKKSKDDFSVSLRHLRIDREALGLLFKTGLPGMLHHFSMRFSGIILSGLINYSGLIHNSALIASTAYGVGLKINSFANLPSNAVCDAEACAVSQNLGANKITRAEESISHSRLICIIINVTMTTALFIFAPDLASILDKDPAVIAQAALFLRIACFTNIGECIVHPLLGFFRGSGNAAIVLINSFVTQYLLKLPVAFICVYLFGMQSDAAAVSMLFATFGTALFYALYFRSGRWRQHLPTI